MKIPNIIKLRNGYQLKLGQPIKTNTYYIGLEQRISHSFTFFIGKKLSRLKLVA
jgi:hypothetical protein